MVTKEPRGELRVEMKELTKEHERIQILTEGVRKR